MITQFKIYENYKSDNCVGKFFVNEVDGNYTVNLVKNIASSDIKHASYVLTGWCVPYRKIFNKMYYSDPYEFQWGNSEEDFEKLEFLTAEELFHKYESMCIGIYEYLNPKKLEHSGIVRYSAFINTLEKSESLMAQIQANKYNL